MPWIPLIMIAAALFLLASGEAQGAPAPGMKITCPDFSEGGRIPARFTGVGENIHPAIRITGVPASAKSLVLIVDDPDAPSGTWNHWLVWNMDPRLVEIPQAGIPPGSLQGMNDSGTTGYVGPCPPPTRAHHYHFRLLALDTVIQLPDGSSRSALDRSMAGHVIAASEYIGTYARSR